ncbi:L-amino-acid oxidase [Cordyceps fumosorosea ARSEF 2679]|uniref:L-amino-acid oxidase n=1 Tax=Cordyceps fumosorosea (strain ARSEF 2679) TaxID=1081104 RepID=A0A167SVI0_CORFA|nr:L-amino-acid oxidase [Cordyceps fumosorosea ARSEF 2679]OAA59965.1 L-amino-acid oxidase [Cordyceps fumosorosea ARSEF 2679]
MTAANGFDPLGVWYAGVEALSQTHLSAAQVEAAKNKNIGIVGAGISGLMTYLVLREAGFQNITILEADQRLGGRLHTSYLTGGPWDYSYQEMGAMRLPVDYLDKNGKSHNISDTQLVFFLIEEMNKRNKADPELQVDLIPWINSNENGLQYFNGIRTASGLPPTIKQISENASLTVQLALDDDAKAAQEKVRQNLPDDKFLSDMAGNLYRAHRKWTDDGFAGQPGDRWSVFSYISQYLKGSLNTTDVLDKMLVSQASYWEHVTDLLYGGASTFRTVDGGFSRLPLSFGPLVKNNTRMGVKVERISYADDQVTLQSKHDFTDREFQNDTFDYAVISPPFTVVRQWRLPAIGATMKNAISNLVYDASCKVALEYSERFWERLENPILGGCSTESDIPGASLVCYPSYDLNGTGKASLLASYIRSSFDHDLTRLVTMSDEEHAQYLVDAMAEIHGEHTRALYTGKFARKCWSLDPLAAGAWAAPSVGQHELYIPEYFKVHKNLIFVGEHTSYTHGWIASSLDSAIRGAVQLLLELGLVDEAKAAVDKWLVRGAGNVAARN